MEVGRGVDGDARVGAGDRLVPEAGLVEARQHLGRQAEAVIVVGHAGVAPIAGHVDVAHLVEERQAVGRHMRLEEAAMGLGLDVGHHGLDRLGKAPVDPG